MLSRLVGGGMARIAPFAAYPPNPAYPPIPAFAPRLRARERLPDRTFPSATAALEHLDAEVAALAARRGIDPHRALLAVRTNPFLLVSNAAFEKRDPAPVSPSEKKEGEECVICRDAVADDGLLIGACGHRCHAGCVAHLVRSYAGQAIPLPYPCPHMRCPGVVERSAMDALGAWAGSLTEAPRAVPRAYAPCPTPGCAAYVLPTDSDDLLPGGAVRCGACGADFCHVCRSPAHPAVDCASLRSIVDALMVPISDLTLRCAVRAVYDGKLPPMWFAEELAMAGLEPDLVVPDPDPGSDVVAEARALLSTSLDDGAFALPELADLAGGAGLESAPRFCPKCFVSIVRVDGCVAMVCTVCHHPFCYDCLGPVHCHGVSCARNPDLRDLVRRARRAGVPEDVASSLLRNTDLVTMDWGALDAVNGDRKEHEVALAFAREGRGARLAVIRLVAASASEEATAVLARLLAKERAWRARAASSGALAAVLDAMRRTLSRVTRSEAVIRVVLSAGDRLNARFNTLLGRGASDALVCHIPLLQQRPRMDVPVYGDVVINVAAGYVCRFGDGRLSAVDETAEVVYVPTGEAMRRAKRLTSAMFRAFFVLAADKQCPLPLGGGAKGDLAAVFHALRVHAHALGLSKMTDADVDFGALALPGRETEARDCELKQAFLVARMEDALGRIGARVWGGRLPLPAPAVPEPTPPPEAMATILRVVKDTLNTVPSEDEFRRACAARWLYGGDPPEAWYLEESALLSFGYFLLDSPSLILPPPTETESKVDDEDAFEWFRFPSFTEADLGDAPPPLVPTAKAHADRVAELRRHRAVRESAMEAEAVYGTGGREIRDREERLRALLHLRGMVRRARGISQLEFERFAELSVVVKRSQELRNAAHASALERVLSRALTPEEVAWLQPAPDRAMRSTTVHVGATVTVVADYKNVERHYDAMMGPLVPGAAGHVVAITRGNALAGKFVGVARAQVRAVPIGGLQAKTWWYNIPTLAIVRGINDECDNASRMRNVDVLLRGWSAMQAIVFQGAGTPCALAPLVRQLHSELRALGDVVQASDLGEAYVAHLVARIEEIIK